MRSDAPILNPKGDIVMPTKKTAKKTKFMKAAFDLGRRI